jgi:hypothetical protein
VLINGPEITCLLVMVAFFISLSALPVFFTSRGFEDIPEPIYGWMFLVGVVGVITLLVAGPTFMLCTDLSWADVVAVFVTVGQITLVPLFGLGLLYTLAIVKGYHVSYNKYRVALDQWDNNKYAPFRDKMSKLSVEDDEAWERSIVQLNMILEQKPQRPAMWRTNSSK